MKKINIYLNNLISKYPQQSFFGLLILLLLLIILGNIIRQPKKINIDNVKKVKLVTTFSISDSSYFTTQAKIEKTGVIKITALTGGVIQSINKFEGEEINKGEIMVNLSNNYQGSNLSSVSRQIADRNNRFINDTYNIQKDLIGKNRETAEKVESQASQLRSISSKSIDESNSLISNSQNLIGLVDSQLQTLEQNNPNGINNATIIQLKQGKVSAQSGLNQLQSNLRSVQYSVNSDNEPAKLSGLQKETILKQLEIQEKSLDLNKDLAGLNLRLAQIQESMMSASAPVSGKIERIHVKIGQNVTAGTLLATLVTKNNSANAIVFVSKKISDKINKFSPSKIQINQKILTIYPEYISSEPTDSGLNTIIFYLPEDVNNILVNDQIVTINLPISNENLANNYPFIPLDAVYQTKTEAYIYIAITSNGKKVAKSQKVIVGKAYGNDIEIIKGLNGNEQIILDRNVIEGDWLQIN